MGKANALGSHLIRNCHVTQQKLSKLIEMKQQNEKALETKKRSLGRFWNLGRFCLQDQLECHAYCCLLGLVTLGQMADKCNMPLNPYIS